MASSQTDPPEAVPEELVAVLQNSADSQLREIINHTQQLLSEHPPITDAIVFTPRGGSRWRKLVTGDVTHNLVRSSDFPILVLPDREGKEV